MSKEGFKGDAVNQEPYRDGAGATSGGATTGGGGGAGGGPMGRVRFVGGASF